MRKATIHTLLLVGAIALGAASATTQVVVQDGEKTFTVEVISADPSAKTLTIKAEKGRSTLAVEEGALTALQGVRPGDKITISTRDEATGRRRVVTAVVNGTVTGRATELPGAKTVLLQDYGTPVGFVSLDPGTRTITVIRDDGERRTFHVEDKAMLSVSDLKQGQRVLLSYRFDRDGKPEAVVRVTPATPVVKLEGGTTLQVVSADPAARTLTIRRDGENRTLVVDGRAALGLKDLKAGDSVVLGLEDDRVVVISRTN